MAKPCGKCKGKGKVFLRGKWTEWDKIMGFNMGTCPVCGGSCNDPNWGSKSCPGWKTWCFNTIDYKYGWDNVPDYCPGCLQRKRDEERQEREKSRQSGQRSSGSYSSSSGGARSNQSSGWLEKTCNGPKGGPYCGNTIRYRQDWSKIPDLCPGCIAKIKAAKAERESRKRTKTCPNCRGEIVYFVGEKEYEYCRACGDKRLRVDKLGNTLQAKTKDGTVVITFGRCTAPPPNRQGGDADRRREWARNGYYWVAMPGSPHETFIVSKNPVEKGFITATTHIDTSYSTAALRNAWQAIAIAVLGSAYE